MFKKQQLSYYTGNYDEYVQQVTVIRPSIIRQHIVELCTLLLPDGRPCIWPSPDCCCPNRPPQVEERQLHQLRLADGIERKKEHMEKRWAAWWEGLAACWEVAHEYVELPG